MKMNFVVVDVETTSLAYDDNEIIDIGLVKIKSNALHEEFNTFLKPKKSIPPIISSLTGITDDDVKDAPSFLEVADIIRDFIGDAILVGHNVNFDYSIINRTYSSNFLSKLDCKTVDTLQLFSIIQPCAQSYKLERIARSFLNVTETFHKAITDARITAILFLKTVEEIKKLDANLLFQITKLFHYCNSPTAQIIEKCFEQRIKHGQENDLKFEWHSLLKPKTNILSSNPKPCTEKKIIYAKTKNMFKAIAGNCDDTLLLKETCNSFNKNRYLIIEAKNDNQSLLQNILPAALWSVQNNRPVVISVLNEATQAQILDICNSITPLLPDLVISTFNNANDYVCLAKVETLLHSLTVSGKTNDVIELAPVLTWLSLTESGLLTELHKKTYYQFHKTLYCEPSVCLNYKCTYSDKCYLKPKKEKLSNTNLLITKHETMISKDHSIRYFLPSNYNLILYDSHKISEIITANNKVVLSIKVISKIFNNLGPYNLNIMQEMVERFETITVLPALQRKIIKESEKLTKEVALCTELANSLFDSLIDTYSSRSNIKIKDTIMLTKTTRTTVQWKKILALINAIYKKITLCLKKAEKLKTILEKADLSFLNNIIFRLITFSHQIKSLSGSLKNVAHPSEYFTSWIEIYNKKEFKSATLHTVLINHEKYLGDNILNINNIIFHSPYITINDKFNYFLENTLIDKTFDDYRCIQNESKALINTTKFFSPIPSVQLATIKQLKQFQRETIKESIKVIPGQVLIVSKHLKTVKKIHSELVTFFSKSEKMILHQDSYKSKNTLINTFCCSPGATIIGTYNFFENINLSNVQISCIIFIDFPLPDITLPLLKTKIRNYRKNNKNWLLDLVIPEAILTCQSTLNNMIRQCNKKTAIVNLSFNNHKYSYSQIINNVFKNIEHCIVNKDDLVKTIKQWLK
ncbi:MAG TPA: hypothetical protein DF296_01680 [Candidatus Margulisbacteria bacterium]|nr:MAG: hypothetical protein A2X43_11315 [Candidatus Margulisbacteria bacterium GWD2_39_127]OGI04167.1 MAG: hypothetical protein A2X42_04600 [Candidatus Margulisbacteria bacterium GWF2_38_17]OGI09299.1 MAG: hypothetical protein A2X41_09235 [Candidatus Margulisbacteria bacterium GWE2_39_32]HAR63948.1 hypothetical protein [Candidatus Margulisiibacteriota bacterium]HCT83887.1 hypothetical protein [Candidatus Margulisiibacteriota bacterium]